MSREKVFSDVCRRNLHAVPVGTTLTYKSGDVVVVTKKGWLGIPISRETELGTQHLDDVSFGIVVENFIRSL